MPAGLGDPLREGPSSRPLLQFREWSPSESERLDEILEELTPRLSLLEVARALARARTFGSVLIGDAIFVAYLAAGFFTEERITNGSSYAIDFAVMRNSKSTLELMARFEARDASDSFWSSLIVRRLTERLYLVRDW